MNRARQKKTHAQVKWGMEATKRQKQEYPVVQRIEYAIDEPLLQAYAATSAANKVRVKKEGNPRGHSDRAIIRQFLSNTKDGSCVVEYDYREIGAALIKEGFITNARVYSRAPYRNDAFELPAHLRAYALASLYDDYDDSKCYHRIVIGTATDEEAKEIAKELLVTNEGEKYPAKYIEIAEFYKKDVCDVKDWFHALSNDQTISNWKSGAGIPEDAPIHNFIQKYVEAQRKLCNDLAKAHPDAVTFIKTNYPKKPALDENGRQVEVNRNPKTCWKAFFLAQYEAVSRDVKIEYCKNNQLTYGPTQHDGLAISKTYNDGTPVDTAKVASELSDAITEKLGFEMVVEVKPMEPTPVVDDSQFTPASFTSNHTCRSREALHTSLKLYKDLLSRYFVTILRMEKPTCVEICYKEDKPSQFIIRSKKATMEIFSGMLIATSGSDTEDGFELHSFKPLLAWYLGDISNSKNYDTIGFFPAPEEAVRHPRALNLCCPLPFDARFEAEGVTKGSGEAFVDAWKDEDEPNWEDLNDLEFLLWHLKYNLCGGNSGAYEYTLQHSFFHFQKRVKPGVVVVFVSAQGLGKSAIYGHNASGPGIMFRIYGATAQKYSNIDQLLKDFNSDSEGKLYCALEEVRPGKGVRNNDALKDKFTEGTMRVEKKGIDPFYLPDHRIFYAMSQHEGAFEIERGDRRTLLNRSRDKYTLASVNDGLLSSNEYERFCKRLNDVKNDDSVAYELFRLGMTADLDGFNVHIPYMTEVKQQQEEANECRVLKFLRDVHSGEFQLGDVTYSDMWAIKIRSKVLWDLFQIWHRQNFVREFIQPDSKDKFATRFGKLADKDDLVIKDRDGSGVKYSIKVGTVEDEVKEMEVTNDF